MMQKRYNLFLSMVIAAFCAATASSCIDKDIPPADVKGVFIEFEAEGQKSAVINTYESTVVVDLLETADPKNVKISKVVLPEGGVCDIAAGSVVDLSSPLQVTIKTVAEYKWTISSTQTIERIFKIGNQVGTACFEESSRSVFAQVPIGTDMSNITVENIKLGPESTPVNKTVMTPDLNGQTVSFVESTRGDQFRVREVKVEYRGESEIWNLYVAETGTGTNELSRSNIWATFAKVTATVLESDAEVVEFGWRKSGAGEWAYVPAAQDAEYDYSGRITGLEPGTGYEVCLSLDGELTGNPVGFTTETAAQPKNAGFEEYGYSSSGNPKLGYYFYKDIADKFWDCGNQGSMTLNKSVTTAEEEARPGSAGRMSAKLQSAYIVLKFAAGNMYSGDYVETVGTNGKINFGREFTSRPSSMSFWYKANAGTVNYSGGGGLAKDDADIYRVFVALTDWSAPKQIFTKETSTFIDWYADPGIIAFGELQSSAAVDDWTQYTIDLKYRSQERVPTHIVIVASSSMYGDYFTGSTKSWMYLDDIELIYNDEIVLQD